MSVVIKQSRQEIVLCTIEGPGVSGSASVCPQARRVVGSTQEKNLLGRFKIQKPRDLVCGLKYHPTPKYVNLRLLEAQNLEHKFNRQKKCRIWEITWKIQQSISETPTCRWWQPYPIEPFTLRVRWAYLTALLQSKKFGSFASILQKLPKHHAKFCKNHGKFL